MKLKFTVFFVLCAFIQISTYGQTYSPVDIKALRALQHSCDSNYNLKWWDDVPPQQWVGITWQLDVDGVFYVVTKLDLSNKNLEGNMEVRNFLYLNSIQCQNNQLSGLTIEDCPQLTMLNCVANQLPISELLKYVYLGNNYKYAFQYAVFEEFTSKTGYIIDYSSQADGGNTKFVFRNRSKPGNDGSEIVAINNTGICPTTEDGVYFCEMVNPKLTQNSFYSHTANISLTSIPAIVFTVDGNEGYGAFFRLTANSDNTIVSVDFGDGVLVKNKIANKGQTYVRFKILPRSVVKIYGSGISELDLLGDPYGEDMKILSLDIKNCPSLTSLTCSNTNLTSLDVSSNVNLTGLYCYDNQFLTSLDVSANVNLITLWCYNNPKITSLVVNNKPQLMNIWCKNNNLSTLNVSNNPELLTIEFSYNKLNTLNLSNNPKIICLFAVNCNLANNPLDLSNFPKLDMLYCDSNKLTSLNVSNNLKLTSLHCSGNQLTELNLRDLPNLGNLDCSNNRLTKLDISNNPLHYLNCHTNYLPISELLKGLQSIDEFHYYPQYAVFEEATYSTNVTLDYSAQADGGNTTFVFRNRSNPGTDGTQIVAVNNTGIYTTQGNGVYFCEMGNPKLNQNGFYSHTANTTIDLSGNSSLKSMSLTEALSAPINEESSDLIKTYPNPLVDVINIELSNNNLPASITLYSIEGKQLKKTESTSAKTTIGMEDLKRGNYIIEIETAKEKIKRKVVKL